MKLSEMFDNLDELRIDNKHGWGAVPDNQNVDYKGLRVHVKPSMFLRLAHELERPFSAGDIENHIRANGSIGAPFLMIAIPQDWFEGDLTLPAEIYGHEGRNRMTAILKVEGDIPVETHLFFGGGLRNRDLTPEIIDRLNNSVISQRGNLVNGPWFEKSVNESDNQTGDGVIDDEEIIGRLNEIRSNPERNPKRSTSDVFNDYLHRYGEGKVYVHFGKLEKVGINPQSSNMFGPHGVYGYPLENAATVLKDPYLPKRAVYANVIVPTPGARILDLDKVPVQRMKELLSAAVTFHRKKIKDKTNAYERYLDASDTRSAYEGIKRLLSDYSRRRGRRLSLVENAFFRSQGYDAIRDTGRIMNDNPNQIVFLVPSAYKVIERIPLRLEGTVNEVAKVRISKDPNDLGAYVHDEGAPEPTVMLNLSDITSVLEPDDYHAEKPGAEERIANMVKDIRAGKKLPPILVRKHGNGYQVLDGHHRFKAYRMTKTDQIPARIVAPENITGDIDESDTKLQSAEDEQLALVKYFSGNIELIKNPTERVQLAAVQQAGNAIEYIKNPSEAVQLAAVKQSGYSIKYIKNPSEAVQLAAVKQDSWAIGDIKNPSEAVQLAAVEQSGFAIKFIENASEAVQLAAVEQSGFAIKFIENASEAVQMAAVESNLGALNWIKKPSEAVLIAAVNKDGYTVTTINNPTSGFMEKVRYAVIRAMLTSLKEGKKEETVDIYRYLRRHKCKWPEIDIIKRSLKAEKLIRETIVNESEAVRPSSKEEIQLQIINDNPARIRSIWNPTEVVKLAAVSKNGMVIGDIKDPSEAVKLAAVRQNGNAFYYIKDGEQSDAVKLAAVQQDPTVIRWMPNPSNELKLAAVKKGFWVIRDIPNPSAELQLAAVKQHGTAIEYIKKPVPEAWEIAKHDMLRSILKDIKEDDLPRAARTYRMLRDKKCPWPEMDAIKRSLRASKAIRESSDWYAMIEKLKDSIGDALESGEYWRALTRMDHLQSYDPGKVKLRVNIEQHRQGLVREMLELIKSGETDIPHGAVICMQNYMGIDWPELSIIKRSLGAENLGEDSTIWHTKEFYL